MYFTEMRSSITLISVLPFVLLVVIPMGQAIKDRNIALGYYEKAQASYNNSKVVSKKRDKVLSQVIPLVDKYVDHESAEYRNFMETRNNSNLMVLVERYPELKADKLFSELLETYQSQESSYCSCLAEYNAYAASYNSEIRSWPTMIWGMDRLEYIDSY